MQWIFLFLTFQITIGFKTLSNSQWSNINNILRITQDENIQTKMRNVIYEYYETWAIQQSHVFKQYHSYVCRDIKGDELAIYGCMGLKKAVAKYDPTKCGIFTNYADYYVKGELYRGVRILHPQASFVFQEESHINEYFTPLGSGSSNSNEMDNEYYSEKWRILRDSLTDFEYRCLTYKYSYDFVKEMSNARIANLMVCSEEHVRKAIVSAKEVIKTILQENGKPQ
jgi:DNA-directed RNA polymerase sigma subunit (sigma70/sigma32)